MKMNKTLTVAGLALVALSFASITASAAVTPGDNDLVLGFQVTDNTGTGASTNLEIDLGPLTNYTAATAQLTLNQLAIADIAATYGSNWASRTDLSWGVAGATPSVGSFDLTYSGTSPKDLSAAASNSAYTDIAALVTGLATGTSTANKPTTSATVATSQGNSYTGELTEAGTKTSDFGNFDPQNVTDANGGAGAIGTDELYAFVPGSGRSPAAAADLGTFTLSANGLTFVGSNPAAVPEPSAYALGICAVLLFLVLKRRHSVA